MYEFYHAPIPELDHKRSRKALKNLYAAIPETEGCMENIAKAGGCGAWCCEIQNPQVMYSEFLYSWNQIVNSWGKTRIIELVLRALKNYLNAKPTKGCVFWDTTSKLCQQHETRPFNCRTYAQTPEDDFKPRYEALKILYQDQPDADLRPQCNLVKSVGKAPSTQDMDGWFNELRVIEQDLGVPAPFITDKPGGTYRTYHDHILLFLGSDKFIAIISRLRNCANEEKETFLSNLKVRLEREIIDVTKIKL